MLTALGLFAVTSMLVCYSLERRSRWFILGFALSCWLGSAYGFLLVAVRRWSSRGASAGMNALTPSEGPA